MSSISGLSLTRILVFKNGLESRFSFAILFIYRFLRRVLFSLYF
jgi:hypothetical protein